MLQVAPDHANVAIGVVLEDRPWVEHHATVDTSRRGQTTLGTRGGELDRSSSDIVPGRHPRAEIFEPRQSAIRRLRATRTEIRTRPTVPRGHGYRSSVGKKRPSWQISATGRSRGSAARERAGANRFGDNSVPAHARRRARCGADNSRVSSESDRAQAVNSHRRVGRSRQSGPGRALPVWPRGVHI